MHTTVTVCEYNKFRFPLLLLSHPVAGKYKRFESILLTSTLECLDLSMRVVHRYRYFRYLDRGNVRNGTILWPAPILILRRVEPIYIIIKYLVKTTSAKRSDTTNTPTKDAQQMRSCLDFKYGRRSGVEEWLSGLCSMGVVGYCSLL